MPCASRPSKPGGVRSKRRRTTLSWQQRRESPDRKPTEGSARARNARSVASGSARSFRPVATTGSASSAASSAAARRSAAFAGERGCAGPCNLLTNKPSHHPPPRRASRAIRTMKQVMANAARGSPPPPAQPGVPADRPERSAMRPPSRRGPSSSRNALLVSRWVPDVPRHRGRIGTSAGPHSRRERGRRPRPPALAPLTGRLLAKLPAGRPGREHVAVNVDVVACRIVPDGLDQLLAHPRDAAARAIGALEGDTGEQRDHHRPGDPGGRGVDVRGDHGAVDARPVQLEADFTLALVEGEGRAAGRVRVARPRHLRRAGEHGGERTAPGVGGSAHGERADHSEGGNQQEDAKSHDDLLTAIPWPVSVLVVWPLSLVPCCSSSTPTEAPPPESGYALPDLAEAVMATTVMGGAAKGRTTV